MAPTVLRNVRRLPHIKHVHPLETTLNEVSGPLKEAVRRDTECTFELKLFRPFYATHVTLKNEGAEFVATVILKSTDQELGSFLFPKGIAAVPLPHPELVREIVVAHAPEVGCADEFRVSELSVLMPSTPLYVREVVTRAQYARQLPFSIAATRTRNEALEGVEDAQREVERSLAFTKARMSPHVRQYAALLRVCLTGARKRREIKVFPTWMISKVTRFAEAGARRGKRVPFVALEPDAELKLCNCTFPVHAFVMRCRCRFFRDGMQLPLTLEEAFPALFYIYTGNAESVFSQASQHITRLAQKSSAALIARAHELGVAVCRPLPPLIFPPFAFATGAMLGCAPLLALCEEIAVMNEPARTTEAFLQTTQSPYMIELVARVLHDDLHELVAQNIHRFMPRALLQSLIAKRAEFGDGALPDAQPVFERYADTATEGVFPALTRRTPQSKYVVTRPALRTGRDCAEIGKITEDGPDADTVSVRFGAETEVVPLSRLYFFDDKAVANLFVAAI
eukprot:gnl/Chilomastix_cuspidata/752.p1 GENE.gnl/Chilomastix_cuspidata/752~~gnl/Chilomastix_cuspidata/752.p1  ORF type:complete len:510 (-),score=215.49 gnl/Chilomastix_cuspidata/752:17-1546(-)